MDGQNGMQRHIALSLLIGLLIAVSPVLAQKQQPQQPAPSPSNPQTTDTQDGGKRYGASFADNSIGSYMTTAIFPSLLHEDPRYYQLGNGRFAHRAYHAINRLFVVRTDSGHERFNFSESTGNAVAAGISNAYHIPEDRTASRNASTFAFVILYDGMNNELKEFWPDICRKVFHKDTP